MLAGVLFVFALIFVQETRPQIILERRAKKLRKESGSNQYRTKDWPRTESDLRHFGQGMMRPLVFLGTHHIVQYLAVYQVFSLQDTADSNLAVGHRRTPHTNSTSQFFIAGTLYLVLSTFHGLWIEKYMESIEISGLNYISIGLGLVLGNQLTSRLSDKVYLLLTFHAPISPSNSCTTIFADASNPMMQRIQMLVDRNTASP